MEDNYGKILVAIDDSEQSYKALKEALAIARRNDSQLYILTVTDMSIAIADARIVQYMRELADEQSKKVTEKIEQHLPSDINYTIRKVEGTPKVSIVQFAKETGENRSRGILHSMNKTLFISMYLFVYIVCLLVKSVQI